MIRPQALREEDPDRGPELGGKGARRPNPEMERLMKRYVREAGLPAYRETDPAPWEPDRCRAIAEEFEALDFRDDSDFVQAAYRALADEIDAQFALVSGEIEIEEYGDEDPLPYRDSAEMMEDVRKNRHLFVYSGGEDHAYLSREENWRFRAVHDLFGHAAGGFAFGPTGEENAWIEHSKSFTPLARAALATETRGQNSWVNCGPYSDMPPKERPYADQKGALLPENRWIHPAVEEAYRDHPEFLYLEA